MKILKRNQQSFIESEVNILSQLNHKNIIRIFDVKQNSKLVYPSGKTKPITYIALELATNGELFDYISETGKFSEKTARYFFR